MTMNIGYVGLNHHHRDPYLDSIDRLPLTVTAVADREHTPSSLGIDRLVELPHYSDPVELFDDADIDVVWLTLSNRSTPEIIEQALDRGIHVFTEKPAARTANDLQPVAEAARDTDSVVGVSYAWRTNPVSEQLQQLRREGFFGTVRGFDLRFVASQLAARDTDHYLFDRDASRGGILQWLGIHWLDLLPWLLDDPIARVCANAAGSDTPGVDIEDRATLQLETCSGAVGTLTCGYFLRAGRYDTNIGIYGDDGHSRWDPMGETFGFDGETTLELDSSGTEWQGAAHRRITHEYQPTPGYGGRWGLSFMEQFLDACRGDGAPPADLDDALTVLRILDAAYESVDTGEWVDVIDE